MSLFFIDKQTNKKKSKMFSMILQQIKNIIVKTKFFSKQTQKSIQIFFENQQRENEKNHAQIFRIFAKIQKRIEFQENEKFVDS